jgi:hypothetical protein
MSGKDPSPEDLLALPSFEAGIVQITRRLLPEARSNPKGDLAAVVLELEAATKGQGHLHAIFQQHLSLVLRECGRHDLANRWQQEAVDEFSKYPVFADRASLLAHALADHHFGMESYVQAEAWAGRSITCALAATKPCPWLADAWRIHAQALSFDNLGPEVGARLRKSITLWKSQASPDPVRAMFAFMGLGMYLLEVGKTDEAEAAFEDAVSFAGALPGDAKRLSEAPLRHLSQIRARQKGRRGSPGE